jgi:hypothetical protein
LKNHPHAFPDPHKPFYLTRIQRQLMPPAAKNPFVKGFLDLPKLFIRFITKSFWKSRNLFSKRFLVVEDNINVIVIVSVCILLFPGFSQMAQEKGGKFFIDRFVL